MTSDLCASDLNWKHDFVQLAACIQDFTGIQVSFSCTVFIMGRRRAVLVAACRVVYAIIIHVLNNKKKHRRRPVQWVRKWIHRRDAYGTSNNLLTELATEDPKRYHIHLRMNEELFLNLLDKISYRISKHDTIFRPALPAKLKLQVTLKYLASGTSLGTLEELYRVPKCSISKFLPHVCDAIYESLQEYIKFPNTSEEWNEICKGFEERCNFPRCIGAIDGKHVILRCPNGSGSLYYDYKGHFSIVLFALCDSYLNFRYINVGHYGKTSDGTIFSHSTLQSILENGSSNIPPNSVILGDEAFPLKKYLMKPYPRTQGLTKEKKIFNYRLSRARRVVENAFGLLVAKWRIFERPIAVEVNTVDKIIKACCALHNWLRKTSSTYITPNFVDRENSITGHSEGMFNNVNMRAFQQLRPAQSSSSPKTAVEIRDDFANYFATDGAVAWQERMIF